MTRRGSHAGWWGLLGGAEHSSAGGRVEERLEHSSAWFKEKGQVEPSLRGRGRAGDVRRGLRGTQILVDCVPGSAALQGQGVCRQERSPGGRCRTGARLSGTRGRSLLRVRRGSVARKWGAQLSRILCGRMVQGPGRGLPWTLPPPHSWVRSQFWLLEDAQVSPGFPDSVPLPICPLPPPGPQGPGGPFPSPHPH